VGKFNVTQAQSGHCDCRNECPLLEVKRTSRFQSGMAASDLFTAFAQEGTFYYPLTLRARGNGGPFSLDLPHGSLPLLAQSGH
jgi:hypothetical protein